jgi:hypothetical protein
VQLSQEEEDRRERESEHERDESDKKDKSRNKDKVSDNQDVSDKRILGPMTVAEPHKISVAVTDGHRGNCLHFYCINYLHTLQLFHFLK